jgi:hypothetical protein
MVRDGQLTAEQARSDPRRNVVTRSVGVAPEVEIDATRIEGALIPGDTLLLCSDGLHGQVADDELADIGSEPDLDAACDDAIALANERGGPDNITIILARVESASGSRPPIDVTSTAPSIPAPAPARARAAVAPAEDEDEFEDDEEDEFEDEDALDDDDDDDDDAPRTNGRAGTATREKSSTAKILVWLIVALVVLVLAVVAMLFVWQRIDTDKKQLEHSEADNARETQIAWRQ